MQNQILKFIFKVILAYSHSTKEAIPFMNSQLKFHPLKEIAKYIKIKPLLILIISISFNESPKVMQFSKGIFYLEDKNNKDPPFPPFSGANPTKRSFCPKHVIILTHKLCYSYNSLSNISSFYFKFSSS